jgi:hypothetical protein
MESPQTVTTSDLALGGTTASARRIQRSVRGSGRAALTGAGRCDTEFAIIIQKVYRF